MFEKNLGSGNTFNINTGSYNTQVVSLVHNQNLIARGDNITQTLENDDIEKIKEFVNILSSELVDVKLNDDDLEDLQITNQGN